MTRRRKNKNKSTKKTTNSNQSPCTTSSCTPSASHSISSELYGTSTSLDDYSDLCPSIGDVSNKQPMIIGRKNKNKFKNITDSSQSPCTSSTSDFTPTEFHSILTYLDDCIDLCSSIENIDTASGSHSINSSRNRKKGKNKSPDFSSYMFPSISETSSIISESQRSGSVMSGYGNAKLTFEEKLNEQRKHGDFCDFTIKIRSGKLFPVHRCIIDAASLYFQRHLRTRLNNHRNPRSAFIDIEITDENMEQIIEFMYTSKITINIMNVQQILHCGAFLQIENLINQCYEQIISTTNKDNCFEMLDFADIYPSYSENLVKHCIKQIYDLIISGSFENIKEKFIKIEPDIIMKYISEYESNFRSDELFLNAILEWIYFDKGNRNIHIRDLFSKIDAKNISKEFCATKIINPNSKFMQDSLFVEAIDKLKDDNPEFTLKCLRRRKKILCDNKPEIYVIFNKEIKQFNWSNNEIFNCIEKHNRTYFASTAFKDFLFVCGGSDYGKWKNDCHYLKLQEEENTYRYFRNFRPMRVERCGHRAIALDNNIYVCGGFNEKTVEVLDVNEEKWQFKASLRNAMNHFDLCTLNNCLYLVNVNNFERYDPRENVWRSLPKLGRNQCSAIGYENFIYQFDKYGVYMFDVRNNRWFNRKITEHKKQFDQASKAILIDDEIYVISNTLQNKKKGILQIYDAGDVTHQKSIDITLQYDGDCENYIQGFFHV